jgi:hypothetical protein
MKSRIEARPRSPSDVRDAIVAQHDVLRGLLAGAISAADEPASSAQQIESLRAKARHLYQVLEEHMTFEDRVLPAALLDVIGWGEALRVEIEEDHRRQRDALATAVGAALDPEGSNLVHSVRVFASALLIDMEREERSLLVADLDALTTDSEGG